VLGVTVAQEAALKLKETAMLHAELFSAAEIMHSPLQMVQPGFPVLAFRPDAVSDTVAGQALERLGQTGGQVFIAQTERGHGVLPFIPSRHPLQDALVMLVSFYNMSETVARVRRQKPDKTSRLRKVTEPF